jgi:molybdopterin/thiamine biosynthesis adenylyltransferase
MSGRQKSGHGTTGKGQVLEGRYSRQALFAQLGADGQTRLGNSSIVVVGCGALGTNAANNMARAGVGRIRLIDRDVVELNNLHRQILYNEDDAKKRIPKAVAAAEILRRANSEITVESETTDVNPRNVEGLVKGFDLVLDATDNMETRFVVNDACVKNGIRWIYTAAVGSVGMMMAIEPGRTACLRCLIEQPPPPGTLPRCDTIGVLNTVTAVISGFQCTEALKFLTGSKDIDDRLLYVDVWARTFQHINARRNPDCPCCGKRDFQFLRSDGTQWATTLCGQNAVHLTTPVEIAMDLDRLARELKKVGEVSCNGHVLSFKADGFEMMLFPNGGALIRGTTDVASARTFYSKYVGT